MTNISLRRAAAGDAEIVAQLGADTFRLTFGHLYSARDLADFLTTSHGVEAAEANLADPAKATWLAERDGVAIGYALAGPCALPHAEVTPACGELKRLYLRPEAQGLGVGGRLFDAALAWLAGRTVWIGVWSENHGAQRFYARRGFEKVGEYGFAVGDTVDREFILRRSAESFSKSAASGA